MSTMTKKTCHECHKIIPKKSSTWFGVEIKCTTLFVPHEWRGREEEFFLPPSQTYYFCSASCLNRWGHYFGNVSQLL